MNIKKFEELGLSKAILRAIAEEGYENPTPIQEAAVPKAMTGEDLLATARTGTGKTAAFSLPILEYLSTTSNNPGNIRALILTPTRELAIQIDENLKNYGRYLQLKTAVILGGVPSGRQISALRKRPEILVATPGRLLDLMNQGHVDISKVEILVLDEADRMLDMGFLPSVRKVVAKVPKSRQTLFFSATMSKEISELASTILNKPHRIEIAPPSSVSDSISQKVMLVKQGDKIELLISMLKDKDIKSTLIFTRTKHRANKIARILTDEGVPSEAIHSNKSQGARQRALAAFDSGDVKVLIGTDLISRGIDVDGISLVINFELPNEAESYVHRIGRTARAGNKGAAISFCCDDEIKYLRDIEKLTKAPLPIDEDQEFHSDFIADLLARGIVPKVAPRGGYQQKTRSKGGKGQSRRRPAKQRSANR